MHSFIEYKEFHMVDIQQSFKNELQKDIKNRFIKLSFILSGILVVLFVSILFLVQNYQLSLETKNIENSFRQTVDQNEMILRKLSENTIPDYLDNNINERDLYRHYYEETTKYELKNELVLTENTGEVIFTTDNSISSSMVNQNYIRNVINSNKNKDTFLKIYTDQNKNRYLISFYKIDQANANPRYSILFYEGSNFLLDNNSFGTQYVIADDFDNVFSSSSNYYVSDRLEKVDTENLLKKIFFEDNQIYLTDNHELATGIYLYSYINFFPIQMLLVLLVSLIVIINIFLYIQSQKLSYTIAERNTKSVDLLVNETRLVTGGYKNKISIATNDEFEYLGDRINDMLIERDTLFDRMLKLEKDNSIFQRKILETQLNPHFLYNTLETIRITAYTDPQITEKLIHSLTNVLRYSLSNAGSDTTVGEDVDIIRDFLEVNTVRFEDLTFKIEMDEELTNFEIPSLFLIPLIENSLKYGMRFREDLIIIVRIYKVNNNIYFEVIDNGPGFSENTIEKIMEMSNERQNHHGIINSYQRLSMYFDTVTLEINRVMAFTHVKYILEEE